MATEDKNMRYGVIIGLVTNDKKIYLSRRIDTIKVYPKKWQLINDELKSVCESSLDAAARTIREETGINVTTNRLHHINLLQLDNQSYYIYMVHLAKGEIPFYIDDIKIQRGMFNHTEWREFSLEQAVVLDLVPCLRSILRKLLTCMKKVESLPKEKKTEAQIALESFDNTAASMYCGD